MNRYWLLLVAAGIFEIGWVTGLKHASNAGEWALTAIGIIASFAGLLYATQSLPVGTAYAVFAGIGAAGTVLAESIFFDVALSAAKLALIFVMLVGIVGLKLTTKEAAGEVEK